MGGWLEGRIPGAALKYRQAPGVLSGLTLAVMRMGSSAEDPVRGMGEETGNMSGGVAVSDFAAAEAPWCFGIDYVVGMRVPSCSPRSRLSLRDRN